METPDRRFLALVGAFAVFGGMGAIRGSCQPDPSAIGGFIAGIIVAGVGATVIAALVWIATFLGLR